MFTPRRDQLVICGQYTILVFNSRLKRFIIGLRLFFDVVFNSRLCPW